MRIARAMSPISVRSERSRTGIASLTSPAASRCMMPVSAISGRQMAPPTRCAPSPTSTTLPTITHSSRVPVRERSAAISVWLAS